ncbi:unnamed protein product, partial [Mesorhabditis belari]|uniref:Uncharacterized protein n=1 Tax=Mesorhabditis belari TaxID=2138241 RepID=A0AAF3F8N9_9BILA
MGFLFSTAAIVLLMFARRTRADTCPDTSPPTLQVPIYQVAMNSPLTTQYIHFPSTTSFDNGTAKTIYQIDGIASTCIAAGCLITLQVMGNQNGNNISIYTIPSSWASSMNYQGFVNLATLNCVQTYGACGATIPLYAYENTKYADEYVNVGYGMDAPAADGYNPMIGGTPLCFLWPVPTTTSTTTTTTTTPFTGSTTTGPTTTTASTTTFTTVSTTTGSTVSTTSYTGSSTTASTVSTTSFTGSTTTGTTVSTTSFTGSTTTGTTVTTTSYTGPSTSTDSTTTGSSTTPYTGSSTTASSTTPYSGSSTTEASTLPYTGPSTTAGQSTLASLGSKIGWPIWITGVLISSLVIMAIIFGATWAFIRGGSSTNPTTNPYANQAHGYKAAHADLPPQPVQRANTGVSTMNVGPTWTQPHSMYY